MTVAAAPYESWSPAATPPRAPLIRTRAPSSAPADAQSRVCPVPLVPEKKKKRIDFDFSTKGQHSIHTVKKKTISHEQSNAGDH